MTDQTPTPDPQATAQTLKKISAFVLIADFLIGAVVVAFGVKLFSIPQAQCFLIGAMLAVGGLVTYFVLRAQAEKMEKYRD